MDDKATRDENMEMDRLFRRTDFATENPGLEERLWQRIAKRMETIAAPNGGVKENMAHTLADGQDDVDLSEDELQLLAAAGSGKKEDLALILKRRNLL